MEEKMKKAEKAIFATKILKAGRITIPEDVRSKLAVKDGDWIVVIVKKLEDIADPGE